MSSWTQNAIAISLCLVAAAYVGWRIWRAMTGQKSGCGSCGSCKASNGDGQPPPSRPLLTIDGGPRPSK